jgi:hypothetical protein
MGRKIRLLRGGLRRFINVCGGPKKCGDKIGRSKQWVNSYLKRGRLPAVAYLAANAVARRHGYRLPLSLFNFDRLPGQRK